MRMRRDDYRVPREENKRTEGRACASYNTANQTDRTEFDAGVLLK